MKDPHAAVLNNIEAYAYGTTCIDDALLIVDRLEQQTDELCSLRDGHWE